MTEERAINKHVQQLYQVLILRIIEMSLGSGGERRRIEIIRGTKKGNQEQKNGAKLRQTSIANRTSLFCLLRLHNRLLSGRDSLCLHLTAMQRKLKQRDNDEEGD